MSACLFLSLQEEKTKKTGITAVKFKKQDIPTKVYNDHLTVRFTIICHPNIAYIILILYFVTISRTLCKYT